MEWEVRIEWNAIKRIDYKKYAVETTKCIDNLLNTFESFRADVLNVVMGQLQGSKVHWY